MRTGVDCKGKEWQEIPPVSSRLPESAVLIGHRFGRLVVCCRVKTGSQKHACWLAKCDCGNEIVSTSGNLRSGNTQSCGCLKIDSATDGRVIDMTGKRYGKLIILNIVENQTHGHRKWHCLCDCGNECDVDGSNLRDGQTISCGCLQKEAASKANIKDRSGETYGYLTVLERVENKGPYVMWRCKCKCGNIVNVRSSNLSIGTTTSCGCRRKSYGEEKIQSILNDNSIKYLYNCGYFSELRGESDLPLRYDFILLDNNEQPYRLIEFDGEQHNNPHPYFGGEKKFEKLQHNDFLKNQYALAHNIPLVRIPYKHRLSITLEDLLGPRFLIKGDA